MAAQMASKVRGAGFRKNVLSFAKTCSIGFRSGGHLGREIRRVPDPLAPEEALSVPLHASVGLREGPGPEPNGSRITRLPDK